MFLGFRRSVQALWRANSFTTPSSRAVVAGLLTWMFVAFTVVDGGQPRVANQGVYTGEQAKRGQVAYAALCVSCHGETLGGNLAPPLTGPDFLANWGKGPLFELVSKIKNTMPLNDAGKLSFQESADIVAYMLQVAKFPAGSAQLSGDEAVLKQITWPTGGTPAPSTPVPANAAQAAQALLAQPVGNLAQVMRGILFPSSNLIFNVQGEDPAKPRPGYQPGQGGFSWADWGAGIYSGWELVDYAAISIADSAALMLTPRRCENGKPAPVEREDWVRFTQQLADAGRAAYKASQSRNRDAVIEVTGQVSDACLACHEVYRDKPGGTPGDPSNKAARCVP